MPNKMGIFSQESGLLRFLFSFVFTFSCFSELHRRIIYLLFSVRSKWCCVGYCLLPLICTQRKSPQHSLREVADIVCYTDLCGLPKSFFQLLVERCLFLCGPHSLLRSSLSAQPWAWHVSHFFLLCRCSKIFFASTPTTIATMSSSKRILCRFIRWMF